MNVYDTLIIGSGYSAVGYAVSRGGCVICEEHQICDTGFYLPLKSFRHVPYTPKTEEGRRLSELFHAHALFRGDEQNANGFEYAFCRYIADKKIPILLKCRVIRTELLPSGIYDVTVGSNEGLTHLFAKRILNTKSTAPSRRFTVLFVCDGIEAASEALKSAFDGAQIEPAFYKGRYALHVPARDTDENLVKLSVYEKWRTLDTDAKILYMAPVFYGEGGIGGLCDDGYANPIEAFEAGYFHAKEEER